MGTSLGTSPHLTAHGVAAEHATSSRGSDRDPNGPRPACRGSVARLIRAIERDPSVGNEPTRGTALVTMLLEDRQYLENSDYPALIEIVRPHLEI